MTTSMAFLWLIQILRLFRWNTNHKTVTRMHQHIVWNNVSAWHKPRGALSGWRGGTDDRIAGLFLADTLVLMFYLIVKNIQNLV